MPAVLAAIVVASAPLAAPPCRAQQISISTDDRDGDFNGMSHSGTLLMLHNRGAVCRIAGLPLVRFADAHGTGLLIVRSAPVGMRPGPVVTPVTIPAHGVASTPLRWVSGEVFDRSRCYSPVAIRIMVGGRVVSGPFAGRLCGPAGGAVGFDQPPLRLGTKDAVG